MRSFTSDYQSWCRRSRRQLYLKKLMRILFPLFLIIALSLIFTNLEGCAQETVPAICPSLVVYTPSQQHALADELRRYPELKEVPQWLSDYIGLRDQVRACEKGGR